MSKGTTEIKKIVYGGLGLAHHEGSTLFVPYTLPGDNIEFSIDKSKKGCLFGSATRIVEPSPLRIAPECPVFGICGGCHMLHASYEDELAFKKQAVLENLERIGHIKTEIGRMIPCPERFGYRNHSQFSVDADGRPGFLKRESNEVVPFPDEGCRLLSEGIRSAIAGLSPADLPPGGEVRVREDGAGGVHFWGLLGSVGPPDLLMKAGGFTFPVRPGSFFQVNSLLNDRMIELVVSLLPKTRRKLLDLYCGTGFFTLPLSRMTIEALGIDQDEDAIRGANAALRLNKVINVKFRRGRVEQLIQRLTDFDLVLADPPRSGIPERALRRIVKIRPAELILVSCEPPTLARDARLLIEAGYILSSVDLVDLFPGTYHIEAVSHFKRR